MAESRPPTRRAPQHRRHRHADGSVRETMEHIVIAFVLAFAFRAFVVEAFVIPTGSMAPTLLGEHLRQQCPACGYRFELSAGRGRAAYCPMCEYPIDPSAPRVDSGDRILVLKYIYAFREPERWDVVVFKNPEEPEVNYIKRLVGLPGEQLRILGGNIYTRPLGPGDRPPADDEPWVIQRKGDRVQRAVWQPVYHSDYFPLDGGMIGGQTDRREAWRVPWRAAGESADGWSFDRRGPRWRFDDPSGGAGVLEFDFRTDRRDRRDLSRNLYPYNMLSLDNGRGNGMVEDMRVAATVLPEEPGGRVVLTCSSREMLMRAVVEGDGRVVLQSTPRNAEGGDGPVEGRWVTRAEGSIAALRGGRGVRLELWHADHALSFWADGRRVARWEYEVDFDWLLENHWEDYEPAARVSVEGGAWTVRSVNLCRDLYYEQTDRRDALGAPDRPAMIASDRFYCLGDNSPQSKDSRLWDMVDPWVEDLTDVPVGYVPRDLMLGKAFFVYYPAPWRLTDRAMGLIPDFGSMRFIR